MSLNELKQQIYNVLIEAQNNKKSAQKELQTKSSTKLEVSIQENSTIISTCLPIYNKVNNAKNINELSIIVSEANKQKDNALENFKNLKGQYDSLIKNNASVKEKNAIVIKMQLEKVKYDNLKKISNLIELTMKTGVKKETPQAKKEETQRGLPQDKVENKEKPTQTIKPETKPQVKPQKPTMSVEDMKIKIALTEISKKIASSKEKYFQIKDKKSKEAIELNKEIYKLCVTREQFIQKYCGNNGINLLGILESKEDEIYSKPDIPKEKTYYLDKDGLENTLSSYFDILSDLQFNGTDDKKKLDGFIRKYENIITSTLSGEKQEEARNFLNLAKIYNTRGGYKSFKEKYPGGMIGSERISKDVYDDGLKSLRDLESFILTESKESIGKNGKVEIKDFHVTRQEKEVELNKVLDSLITMAQQGKKAYMQTGRGL